LTTEPLSNLYIHYPFCRRKCTFCYVNIKPHNEEASSQYVDSLLKEISFDSIRPRWPLKSIYLGGGTPSLMNEFEISQILDAVRREHKLEPGCIITMECTPDDCTPEKVQSWVRAGINRVAIGIQSFSDEVLLFLNRPHNSKENLAAIQVCTDAAFDEVSIDLLWGLHTFPLENIYKDLDVLKKLDNNRIHQVELFLYSISEPGCPAYRRKTLPHSLDKVIFCHQGINERFNDMGLISCRLNDFRRQPEWKSTGGDICNPAVSLTLYGPMLAVGWGGIMNFSNRLFTSKGDYRTYIENPLEKSIQEFTEEEIEWYRLMTEMVSSLPINPSTYRMESDINNGWLSQATKYGYIVPYRNGYKATTKGGLTLNYLSNIYSSGEPLSVMKNLFS